jgi:hypothetical protein
LVEHRVATGHDADQTSAPPMSAAGSVETSRPSLTRLTTTGKSCLDSDGGIEFFQNLNGRDLPTCLFFPGDNLPH